MTTLKSNFIVMLLVVVDILVSIIKRVDLLMEPIRAIKGISKQLLNFSLKLSFN